MKGDQIESNGIEWSLKLEKAEESKNSTEKAVTSTAGSNPAAGIVTPSVSAHLKGRRLPDELDDDGL